MNDIIPVAIALVSHNGCYLVGRRGPDGPLAGYYEFPGGKCHAGEPPEACVVRECREETGLEIQVLRLRRAVKHAYPYGMVHLHFFDCELVSADCTSRPRQSFEWVPRAQLASLLFPEPNHTLVVELTSEAPTGLSA